MLKLYNKEHVAVGALTNSKDYKIEYLLSGEDQLEFSLSICDEDINLVEEEGYVRNKYNEYVIKAVDPSQNFKRFSCIVNIEAIKAKSIKNFEISNNTITEAIRLTIAGTGWILADNNINKRRTVRVKNTDALGVLREIRKVFMIDYRFDAINKVIYVHENFGSDKGAYFSDELNLKILTVPSDTYDYATRLYCYGKDGINIASINGGKEYVENFQYSNKVIEKIWTDDRYTVAENLKADAEAKLEELSKPKRSYRAEIIDLARNNKEYKFLDFFLGDTITLLSKAEKFRDKQRIVKYIEYPNDPSKNTCELGNTRLTFEELQKENEAKNQVVNNITSDNGTINGETIDSIKSEQISDFETSVAKITNLTVINADITNLKAQNVTITGELNTVKANVGTLTSNVATIDKLTVTHSAFINDLQANKASITQLEAVNATIQVLEADVGKIQTLVNGNLSSENIQAGGITSDKLTIMNGFITNAMIANLDVSKVNAGDISTNKFRITSDSGNMLISDNTIQIRDNSRVRVQIGKDASNDYNMYVWDATGKLMFDATGLKAGGIKEKIIRDDMISDNANISGNKLNINSVVTSINNGTTTIKGSKVMLDETGQTLNVSFNSLKTEVQGIQIGGRNLKQNTSAEYTTANMYDWVSDSLSPGRLDIADLGLDVGDVITFSVYLNFANSLKGGLARISFFKADGTYTSESNKLIHANAEGLSYVTAAIPTGCTRIELLIQRQDASSNQPQYKFKYKKIKLEKGNKATDWTPAPEDVAGQINAVKEITTTHSTDISVIQGEIKTAINNTQIVKDGQTILLKDDYNRTVQTVNSMSSTIGQHSTTISQQTGQITGVTSRVNTVERNLNNMSSKLNSVESTATTTKSKVSAIEQSLTNISARLSNTESTLSTTKSDVTQIKASLTAITQRVSSTEVKTASLLQAMDNGKVLYDDPTFLRGANSIHEYNNAGNNVVTVTRVAKVSGCPTNSTHCLEVKTIGGANPGHGGFYFGTMTRANAIFITKIIAKIPTGKKIVFASNGYGDEGRKQEWLTLVEGTGKWETYICKVTCGSNGTFSSTNFFYLTGGGIATTSAPVIWHVGYATVIDITDSSNLESRMNYAESKITSKSIIDTVSSQFYKKGETDSKYASQTQVSQLDSKITSTVTTVENWQSSDTNTVLNSKINETSSNYGFGYRKVRLERGKKFTLTANGRIDQKALTDGKKLAVIIYNDDWTWSRSIYIDSTSDVNKSITFDAPDSGLHNIQAYLYPNGGSRTGKATVNWYKNVGGNIPSTNWSPSPEDIDGTLDRHTTEITQLNNQIVHKVDSNGVISIIQQNSNAVNIAFNKINPNVQHNPGMFTIRNGKFEMFDNTNTKIMYVDEHGLISSRRGFATYHQDQSGIHLLGNIIYHVPNSSGQYDNIYFESNKPFKFKTALSWDGVQGKDYQQIICSGIQLDGKAWSQDGIQGYVLAADYELDTVVMYNQYKGINMNIKARNAEFSQLTCTGAKNRIVKTKSYGTRALNAVESAECYFEDRGRGKVTNGKCKIEIDSIFAETVNIESYDIHISKYGKGDIWVSERTKEYFIVECDKDIEFSYIIYSKQLGYENDRLEIYKESNISEIDKTLIKNNLNIDTLKNKNSMWKIYEK